MVAAFVLGGLLVATAVVFVGKKYHSLKAFETAVKAEVAKIEGELSLSKVEAFAKAEVSALVARIKSL